ncbi:MAG: (E)-4-hydroxy-3-methylbut-2-enyl-diphosphate synthase [Prevotellaceae bacterium]|jgi:(E)-4-hydroxy-3-methylbut-2-enyl-diphosphate synthase|nr:(E)-4-hydroxy-3-methylbut-2-enyl-diphosphate synthase [Prevotellaceae bacterium]
MTKKLQEEAFFSRRRTVEVKAGNVCIGGNNPVRVQTMVTSPTSDIEATVNECIKVARAGAELVRITAPTVRDAEALGAIRSELRKRGYGIPLIADIHFNPDVAEIAAKNVEKIRINPGNFTDRQAMLQTGVPDIEQNRESDLLKLRTRFTSLLNICREYRTALRIGSNHGSLSQRIMSKYGDTPAGMVESAMEFLRICREEHFDNVIVSMKASNTVVMVQAYRLLVAAMDAEDMHYPLHLGVTEAGDGEDGRIKSAVGIGSLLADGLGDTIRVSLTEAPENEIPVARELVRHFSALPTVFRRENETADYPCIETAKTSLPGKEVLVISDLSGLNPVYASDIESLGFGTETDSASENPVPDCIYTGSSTLAFDSGNPKIIDDSKDNFILCSHLSLDDSFLRWLKENPEKILAVSFDGAGSIARQRSVFLKLRDSGVVNPVIIVRSYREKDFEKLQIMAACDFGALLIDGFGDGIMLSAECDIPPKSISDLCFRILQAARRRYTRTEYIACPGCGRTLFDLQETLKKVKAATSELKNLKIGVMGCIVNGPGEMADADYGYVGAGPGKITLYKGREAVKKNIPQENAIDELIKLIKEN